MNSGGGAAASDADGRVAARRSAVLLSPPWVECLAVTAPLLGAFGELVIRDTYHQVSAEPTRFAYLGAFWILSLIVAASTARSVAGAGRVLRTVNRVFGIGLWAWIVWIRGGDPDAWAARTPSWMVVAVVAVGVLLAWLAWKESRWKRVRPALLAATVLFVASQVVLSKSTSQHLTWPDPAVTTAPASTPGDAPEGVVVVLLDELNAHDGPRLAEVLARAGLEVASRAIAPVADGTAKVIPQIWTGRAFPSPKPCSFTAICSEGEVLDFAKVSASRPDIDVVGFYHPYCAMQGLRSCVRVGIPLPFDEAGRWECAARRRLGLSEQEQCVALQHEPWLQLQDDVVRALWQAPFWRRGGLLYAHLPLPHPPGKRPGGTLRQHYEDNLVIAAGLLREMADRVQAAGFRRARLVVFSDHPLRQALWCAKHAYQLQGCRSEPGLADERVPLIVASLRTPSPDLGGVGSNGQVFRLANLPGR